MENHQQTPTKGAAYLWIMAPDTFRWSTNWDSLLLKPSEQNKTMSNRQWTIVSLYNPTSLTVAHSRQNLLFNTFENILSIFNTVEQMHTIKMV
jgi:hypothetical protein